MKTLYTNSRMQLINKHAFAKMALDENSKTLVVYVVALKALESTRMTIYPFWIDLILLKAQLAIF